MRQLLADALVEGTEQGLAAESGHSDVGGRKPANVVAHGRVCMVMFACPMAQRHTHVPPLQTAVLLLLLPRPRLPASERNGDLIWQRGARTSPGSRPGSPQRPCSATGSRSRWRPARAQQSAARGCWRSGSPGGCRPGLQQRQGGGRNALSRRQLQDAGCDNGSAVPCAACWWRWAVAVVVDAKALRWPRSAPSKLSMAQGTRSQPSASCRALGPISRVTPEAYSPLQLLKVACIFQSEVLEVLGEVQGLQKAGRRG